MAGDWRAGSALDEVERCRSPLWSPAGPRCENLHLGAPSPEPLSRLDPLLLKKKILGLTTLFGKKDSDPAILERSERLGQNWSHAARSVLEQLRNDHPPWALDHNWNEMKFDNVAFSDGSEGLFPR